MKHLVVPSVNVSVISGTKILLSRRSNTGWMDGHLCLPGGHVEKGETPLIAIVREITEELGVAVRPEDLEFACVAARNTSPTEYVAYEFVLRDTAYRFTNAEPGKCSELVWAELRDLPQDTIDDFRQIIKQGVIAGRPYLEIGYQYVDNSLV
jgi:mutator protein MutT